MVVADKDGDNALGLSDTAMLGIYIGAGVAGLILLVVFFVLFRRYRKYGSCTIPKTKEKDEEEEQAPPPLDGYTSSKMLNANGWGAGGLPNALTTQSSQVSQYTVPIQQNPSIQAQNLHYSQAHSMAPSNEMMRTGSGPLLAFQPGTPEQLQTQGSGPLQFSGPLQPLPPGSATRTLSNPSQANFSGPQLSGPLGSGPLGLVQSSSQQNLQFSGPLVDMPP